MADEETQIADEVAEGAEELGAGAGVSAIAAAAADGAGEQPAAPPAVDPDAAALETMIKANPVLSQKIALADALRGAGKDSEADRYYNEITAELGLVDPAAAVPIAPAQLLPKNDPGVNTQDEEAEWGVIANKIETGLENKEREYEALEAQRQSLLNTFNAKVNELIDPEGESRLDIKTAKNVAAQMYGERFDKTIAERDAIGSKVLTHRAEAAHMRLVESQCKAVPELAAIKATYAKLTWENKQRGGNLIEQRPADQLQALQQMGVKLPSAKPANTITRSTMDKLKGLRSPLSASKTAGSAGTGAGKASNTEGATPAALNYFASLTGRKFA